MKYFIALTVAVSLTMFSTISIGSDSVVVSDQSAWARATPKGGKTTAIYLTLMNHTDSDISLTSASADISDHVELHTTTTADGMMKMQEVNSITIPAGGTAALKPRAEHIMVFNLQDQLAVGTDVTVELTFDNGETQTITVPALKESPISGEAAMDHDSMKQNSMKHDAKKSH